jgi:hypothetical protein
MSTHDHTEGEAIESGLLTRLRPFGARLGGPGVSRDGRRTWTLGLTRPYRQRLILCVSILLFSRCDSLLAHVDTLIQLKNNRLVGLPEKFTPAELDLTAGRLRIGHHAMTFSPFLKSLFDQPHDLDIAASWYHDPKTLPPYISLRIKPKMKDFRYSILLNLETLELIEVSVTLRESATTTRRLPIAISDDQKQAIRRSIRTLK